jgi:hypothetical protein
MADIADTILPQNPFDGQVFIDAYNVEWIFDGSIGCWMRTGKVNSIPVANSTTNGLLSKELKYLIDKIKEKGGGFGIVTKPNLRLRTLDNPDGVLFGEVEFISDTLDISCIDSQGNKIGDACTKVCFKETDEFPPGFDLNFSDLFLESFCVQVPGGPGPQGIQGEKGDTGADGTGDGPIGPQGDAGKDATEAHKFTGIKVEDTDAITDVAVSRLDIDQNNGKLFVTKAKINVPGPDEEIADQLIVSQIVRNIRFTGNCFEFELSAPPSGCSPDQEPFDTIDPTIAYYPAHFDASQSDRTYQLVRASLSSLINDIIKFYQAQLDEASDGYDKVVSEFLKTKDSEARKALDELGDRLAECEHITYLDYCVGVNEECPGATGVSA